MWMVSMPTGRRTVTTGLGTHLRRFTLGSFTVGLLRVTLTPEAITIPIQIVWVGVAGESYLETDVCAIPVVGLTDARLVSLTALFAQAHGSGG